MTIAVVATCVGKPFHQFSQGWIKAVLELERKPDEIVISTDLVKREIWLPDGVVRYVPVTQQPSNGHWAFAVNEAIAVTSSDWICKIDIDDLILPHALNELDACEADVYCFGIKIGENEHYATQVNAEILLNQNDPQVYSNSPYRRWVWEAHPYENMFYEDGVFWYAAAVEGATFAISPNIDYVYGIHANQTTKHIDHIKCIKDMNTRKEEMLSARARE